MRPAPGEEHAGRVEPGDGRGAQVRVLVLRGRAREAGDLEGNLRPPRVPVDAELARRNARGESQGADDVLVTGGDFDRPRYVGRAAEGAALFCVQGLEGLHFVHGGGRRRRETAAGARAAGVRAAGRRAVVSRARGARAALARFGVFRHHARDQPTDSDQPCELHQHPRPLPRVQRFDTPMVSRSENPSINVY